VGWPIRSKTSTWPSQTVSPWNVSATATDSTWRESHSAYRRIEDSVRHDRIHHELAYEDGDVHTQNIEGYWSLLKRGLIGTFHHVDRTYLPMYLSEFQYRWNQRKVSDAERFEALLGQTEGRLDWYLTA